MFFTYYPLLRLENELTLNMQCIGYMVAPYFLYFDKYLVSLGQSNGSITRNENFMKCTNLLIYHKLLVIYSVLVDVFLSQRKLKLEN
uniref:Uncharacterized protein n=1 Tax=Glossina pallidipes TaxID=7398 RepID=A0A1A9ZMA6_GLOPL